MSSRKLAALIATAAIAAAVTAAPASADTYAPGANNQTFATGFGGWTQSSSDDGLCVPAVTCLIINNVWTTSGGGAGGPGDGYLSTQVSAVAAAATTSNAVWQSPTFTYNGNAGAVPSTATFT